MDKKQVRATIGTLLMEQNIDAYDYCSAALFEGLDELHVQRAESGLSCEFEHRASLEELCEPELTLAGGKSFLVILLPHSPYTYKGGADCGRMASGTASEDYHEVIRRVLTPVKAYLFEAHGIESKIIVDTSPLSDRAIAQRSGLGILRRNNLFYHKKYGSYVHIGALLMNEALHVRDVKKINDPCGHCRKCLAACPGQAILGDGSINSNKCVSYLTQKKVLSDTESAIIGTMIYGCDICQRVCPINQGAENQAPVLLVEAEPNLVQLLEISNSDFSKSYKKTSSGWRGKRTLQRNAIAVMGNLGNKSCLEHLKKQAMDQRPIIREEAERALYKLSQKE